MAYRLFATVVVSWAAASGLSVVAQDGDYLLYDRFGYVRVAARGMGLTSATPIPQGLHSAWASTAGPDDTVFLSARGSGQDVHIVSIGSSGATTLATFVMPGNIYELDIDDAGRLRFLWNDTVGGHLYTAPIGSSTPTRLLTWPASLRWPQAFVEDHATGDLFVTASPAPRYFRLDPLTGIVTSMTPAPTGTLYFSDPATGDLIIGVQGSVARFDLRTGATATLYQPPVSLQAVVSDVHFDQATRNWVVAGEHISGLIFYGFYAMIDPKGTVISINAPLIPFSSFERIEVAHGRVFLPLTPPTRGRDYRVRLRAHHQPGVAYQAAFAFTHLPGLPTPAGTIPLTLDPLFVASLAGGPSFGNLAGILDASGSAVLELRLRVAPAGLRLHLAAVTYDGTGIRSILGPHSFTVR